MSEYWITEWKDATVSEYKKYINPNRRPKFFDIFKEYNISYVCDVACGFYTENDIKNLIKGREQIYYNITSKGDREVILRK